MFCSQCGTHAKDGEHFCSNCGASLQNPGAVQQSAPGQVSHNQEGRSHSRAQDPYKGQLADLRLQLKQLKLDLKQINNSMGRTRSHYDQTRAFLPWSIREGSKWFEDLKLMGKQPQKEQLQGQIANLQQQILQLEQAQVAWKREQQALR
ncbi:MAG TPA: zinc ribbon domain-containing protein [Ktedonobacteraceae bacterium]